MRTVALLLSLLLLVGCSTTGTTTPPSTNNGAETFIAQGLGVAAVQNYLKDNRDGAAGLVVRLEAAQALLLKGATFEQIREAIFAAIPQQDLVYAVIVISYVQSKIPAGTGIIDPKSQTGQIIQAALDGAKLAVAMSR